VAHLSGLGREQTKFAIALDAGCISGLGRVAATTRVRGTGQDHFPLVNNSGQCHALYVYPKPEMHPLMPTLLTAPAARPSQKDFEAKPEGSARDLVEGDGKTKMIEKVVVRPPEAEDDTPLIVPVHLPETDKIMEFACAIHAQNKEFEGEFEGWPASYWPMDSKPPLDSKAPFTPAMFTLGHPAIWLFCLDWNAGNDQPPSVLTLDNNIVRNDQVPARKTLDQLLAAISNLQATA